jgi:hypothetical protein
MRTFIIAVVCLIILAVASYLAGGRELLEVLSWRQ